MSLLGSQVYANSDTPIWVSAAGGTIAGNVVVEGTLEVDGASTLANTFFTTATGALVGVGAGANVGLELRSGGVDANINSDGTIFFGREGASGGSTSITPGATANTDVVVIGGRITTPVGGAITPISGITSTKTINPVPTDPAPAQAFVLDTNIPTILLGTYDVELHGRVLLASGTPDPNDVVLITLTAGITYPLSIWSWAIKPSETNLAGFGLYQHRIRLTSDSPLASMSVSAVTDLAGASTAVYSASLIYFNSTRVD